MTKRLTAAKIIPLALAGWSLALAVLIWVVGSSHAPSVTAIAAEQAGLAQPAAQYVGQDTCIVCHSEISDAFENTAHGRSAMPQWAGVQGCEACHGPGSLHVESLDPRDLVSSLAGSVVEANEQCLTCHTSDVGLHWRGSDHEMVDVRCSQCHSVHRPWTSDNALANRDITASCLTCHQRHQRTLSQRSTHPLRNGQMSCIDCHSPHGSAIQASVDALTVNDKCYQCHAETRGPFLWEHIPVREDCTTCHEPHGTNQLKLLKQSGPRLCQSCHLFGHHQTVPGTPRQIWNTNRSCTNCHSQIHGSNHPSGILFMR